MKYRLFEKIALFEVKKSEVVMKMYRKKLPISLLLTKKENEILKTFIEYAFSNHPNMRVYFIEKHEANRKEKCFHLMSCKWNTVFRGHSKSM